jgi:hypothetical protein
MLEVVTRAGHQACEYWLQHRGCQFEGKSRLAADGDSQQSAAVAVRLAAVVLNPGMKRRCGRGIDTEGKTSAFIPDEYRFVNPDTDDPLRVARANAVRRRRLEMASSVEAGEELPPVGRVMCKRGEDLARRSLHIDGGIKADWSGVEEIQIDGFAGNMRILLFRREFPPADNRNHDPDQRRDRTSDGPGCGVAHLATSKHSESLESPDQTEQCEHQPECERNDESPSHTGILRAIWSASFENVDRRTTHTDRISQPATWDAPSRFAAPVASQAR